LAKKTTRLLITGASGFIGRNLLEQLGPKYEILAPKSSELDLTSKAAVEKYLSASGIDVVIHAASRGVSRREQGQGSFADANFRMFQNLASCSGSYRRMIQIGSGAEYDKSRPIVRAKEGDFGKRVPKDDYGQYKYRCSKYIEGADNIVCLRLFGCYGKYEDYETRFISNAIAKAVFGMPITIANRNVVFSYLYIDDFARIAGHFVERGGKEKFYNVAPDETADLLSIARKVVDASGKGLEIIVKNEGMGNEYSGDNSRLKSEIPSLRFTPIDEGIRRLYDWYSENKSLIDRRKISADRY
jgi:UDP-glucose 4-epimerase